MTFTVTINDQKFDVQDRLKKIIASIATGDRLSLYDGHSPIKVISVESFTNIVDDELTVHEYIFKGTETSTEDLGISERPKDADDKSIVWLDGSAHIVSGELALHYSHLTPQSIVRFNNADYRLTERLISIITEPAPMHGLWSRVDFTKV